MTMRKSISIFCIIFNLTNALAYSEPVSLIYLQSLYLIIIHSFLCKFIFSQVKMTSTVKFDRLKFESVTIPIPCILFDLGLTELIIKRVIEQASNQCHSNVYGYGYEYYGIPGCGVFKGGIQN